MFFKYFWRKRFLSKIERSGNIYLTFDDGPNPKITIEILRILKEYNTKVTFFLLGQNVEKYSSVVDEIKKMGHAIGEHSYGHTHAWFTGPIRTAKDLLKGKRVIEKYLDGENKILFRPPYGKMNLVTIIYVLFYRRIVAFWNIDPKDYFDKNENEISSYVLPKLKSGTIVLFHDNNLFRDSNSTEMVGALRLILEKTKETDIKFSSLNNI